MTRSSSRSRSVTVVKAPAPLTVSRPTFSETVKEGFGLGVGVSVAQHAVNNVINFLTPPKSSNSVDNSKVLEYEKCMKYSSNDSDLCKSLLNN